jgi:hypothetical protein
MNALAEAPGNGAASRTAGGAGSIANGGAPREESDRGETRRRWQLATTAAVGIALFGWTIASVGPRELVMQLRGLSSVLPLLLALAGLRFLMQAAGWRLAMAPEKRPPWHEAFAAVVAGEAAGYFAWGTVSREPMKAWLVAHRLSQREALAAAVVERTFYSLAAMLLIVASIGIVAARYGRLGWLAIGVATLVMAAAAIGRITAKRRAGGNRGRGSWIARKLGFGAAVNVLPASRAAMTSQFALATAQELSNLVEAYLVFTWLGATPAIAAVIALEGIGRLLNGAGQFIPGKLGVTEAVTAALADGLSLGATYGLSLALARRVRSLAWGALGIAFVGWRAINATSTGSESMAMSEKDALVVT